MPEEIDVDDLDLSDTELLQVLKNHGIDRRGLMKVLSAGAGVAALSGTAAAKGGRDARIDDVFGAPYSTEESPPPGLADHVVELHAHSDKDPDGDDPEDVLGALADFPQLPDGPDPDSEPDEYPTEFFFDPVGLHVQPGDIVNFSIHSHEHTVTSFHRKYLPLPPNSVLDPPLQGTVTRVPDGPFTSPPLLDEESWLYRFTTEGVYDLLCLPHLGFGMVMRVVVSESEEVGGFEDYGNLPLSAFLSENTPLYNANLVLTDEELDPQNIVDNGPIGWADLTPDTS